MKVLLLIFSAILFASCLTNKKQYGSYYNPWRFYSASFLLKPDSTFNYSASVPKDTLIITTDAATGITTTKTETFIFIDSSYGIYSLKGDTVLFNYLDNIITRGLQTYYYERPDRLFWEGKNLYYFFTHADQPLRQKEYYLKWRNNH